MDPESDYPFYQDERVTIGETLSKAKSSLFSELQDAGYLCEFSDIFSIKFLRDKDQDKVLVPPAPILDLLTGEQRHIIGHANGNNDREPGWRDYYCTTDGNEDCERLVSLGLMKRGRILESVSTSRYYLLTEAGAQAALSDAIIPRSVAERMIPWQPHLLEKGLLSLKAIKDNPSLLESMGNPMCRIYSAQWGYYWRPKACGYGAKEEAGLYEFQDAYMTTKHCGPEKKIWYEFVENDEVKANEQAIRSAIDAIQEMHKQYDALNQVLSLDHSGPFTDAIWQLENRLVEALDVDGWLEWFVSTNSFGDNGMLAGYPPNCCEIHTVDDLIELMKEAQRRL